MITACKTKQKMIDTESPVYLSQESLVRDLFQKQTHRFFSAKAKATVQDANSSYKGTMYLRIRPDSVIWTAVKKLSVEGGRVQIDSAVVSVINRLEKTYQTIPLDSLTNLYGLTTDLSSICDLVMGYPPALDTAQLWKVELDTTYMKVLSLSNDLICQLAIDRLDGHVKHGSLEAKVLGLSCNFTFDDYRDINGSYLPFYRRYEFDMGKDEYLSVQMEFSSIELDVPKSIKFEIPEHYTKTN